MTLFGDYICGNMSNVLYDAKAYVEGDLDLNDVFQENSMEEEDDDDEAAEAEHEYDGIALEDRIAIETYTALTGGDLSEEEDINTDQLRDILQDEAIAYAPHPPDDEEDDAINTIPNTNTGGDDVSANNHNNNNSSLLTSPFGRSVLNSPIPFTIAESQSFAMEEEKMQDVESVTQCDESQYDDMLGQPRVGPPRL